MGVIPDPHQLQHKYKLTTNYRLDATNEEQLAQQMNQMNQSLAEMVQAIEELNSQLEEYVRTLTDSIGRFRQMIRPVNGSDVPQSSSEDDQYLDRMRNQLEQIQRDSHQQYERVFNELNGIHEANLRVEVQEIPQFIDINRRQGSEGNGQNQVQRKGFLSRAFNFVKNGVRDFVQVVILSS